MTKEILPFNDSESFKAAFISEYGTTRWGEFVAFGKVNAVVKDMMGFKNAELFSFRDIPHAEQRSGYILHIADEVAAEETFLSHFGVTCAGVAPRLAVTVVESTLFVIASQNAALVWPSKKQIKHAIQMGVQLFENLNKKAEEEQPAVKELPAFPTVEKLDQVEKQLIDMFGKTNTTIEIKRGASAVPVDGEPYTALLCHVSSIDGAFGVICSNLSTVFSTDLGRPHGAYTNIGDVVIIFYMHLKEDAVGAEKDILYFYNKIAADERIKTAFKRAKSETEKESQTMANEQQNVDVCTIQEILTKHGVKFTYKVVDLFDGRGNTMPVPTFYVSHLFPGIDCLAKFNPRHTPDGSYILLSGGQVVLFIDDLWDFNGTRLFDAVYRAKNQDLAADKNNAAPSLNVARFNIGLTPTQEASSNSMYQHYVAVPHHKTSDVAADLIAQILKHKNMHSLPMYGSLCRDFQDDLSLHRVTPINVFNGEVCWVREILATGVTFSDVFESIVDDGVDVKYHLYVMHLHIDDRNLAVCVSKRYTGKKTTPSYLLNVVELLDDKHKPFDGDVIKHIYQYLAAA